LGGKDYLNMKEPKTEGSDGRTLTSGESRSRCIMSLNERAGKLAGGTTIITKKVGGRERAAMKRVAFRGEIRDVNLLSGVQTPLTPKVFGASSKGEPERKRGTSK